FLFLLFLVLLFFYFFFFLLSFHLLFLHSFPTRRSSDLLFIKLTIILFLTCLFDSSFDSISFLFLSPFKIFIIIFFNAKKNKYIIGIVRNDNIGVNHDSVGIIFTSSSLLK